MRNPQFAVPRIPGMAARGIVVESFLKKAVDLWPKLLEPATAILTGETPCELPQDIVDRVRHTLVNTLWGSYEKPKRTAKATTPLRPEVIAGWTEDPDAAMLAKWLLEGAPMGYSQDIPTTGIFPTVSNAACEQEFEQIQAKSLDGWENYESAKMEEEELIKLVKDYVDRGFCHVVPTLEDAGMELGRPPVVNRLAVIVKTKTGEDGEETKKSRIVWDLRRSGANAVCRQSERILLPRLLDVAAHALDRYRQGEQECWLAAVDIRDAFMNIPVMEDRFALAAAVPTKDEGQQILIFDTLVFGAATAPTIWGRYAAFLGRTLAAIQPQVGCQVYVDDPIFILTGDLKQAAKQLAITLLWMAVAGYPIKASKAVGGKALTWVGAGLTINDAEKTITVSIPAEKVSKLLDITNKFIKKPVVGARELRSYAGALSFVAGLIPHLRPFLAAIWAVLPFNRVSTNDGARGKGASGKMVHVRRIRPSLMWIQALLHGSEAKLQRTLQAFVPELEVTITTDACPFGIGGTLRVSGELKSSFASDLPKSLLEKFKAARGDAKHTTLWEAFALLFACRTWLPSFKGRAKVRCKSDSLSLLQMLMKGRAKSADLSVIAREFAIDLAKGRYRLHLLKHIPGITNIEADALSRVCAPIVPALPLSLAGVPRVAVDLKPDFWIVTV